MLRRSRFSPSHPIGCARLSFLFVVILALSSMLWLSRMQYSESRTRGSRGIAKWFRGLRLELTVSKDVKDVFFILWTRRQERPQRFGAHGDISEAQLKATHFNASNPVLVFFHGFADHSQTSWALLLKSAYLKLGDVNIVSVDWSKLDKQPWYSTAVRSAQVGDHVSSLLVLMVSMGVSPSDLHLLGASLGAHVASSSSFFFTQASGKKVGRLTGLDPCGPLFHTAPLSSRLDASDADFVDVIHTAGKWMGLTEAVGHVDFFVNDGHAPQPGCEGKETLDLACSHFKAWQIFGAALQPQVDFVAVKCDDHQDFHSGQCCQRRSRQVNANLTLNDSQQTASLSNLFTTIANTRSDVRGKFYLLTNAQPPLQIEPWWDSVHCPLLANVSYN